MRKKQLIIDASCIMAVITDEKDSKVILEKTAGYELVSSTCLPYEICNAISKLMKRNIISVEQGLDLITQFNTISLKYVESDFERTVKIAGEECHYCYDMFYVENALRLGLPILSLDDRLKTIAEKRGVKCL